MAAAEPLVEANSICKSFGSKRVLRSASLACARGEVVLLLGANGAGKSTLLRVMAGLSRADSGSVRRAPGASLGFLSHHLFLYSRLTVEENLALFASVSGAGPEAARAAIECWGLEAFADRAVSDLSRGNQARAGLARAFIGAPHIRLLDEPSGNLDDRGVEALKVAVAAGGDAATVLATHDLHRLSDLATRVVVMRAGEMAYDSGPATSADGIARAISMYRETNR